MLTTAQPSNALKKDKIFNILSYLAILLFFGGVLWTATVPWVFKYRNGHSSAHVLTTGRHFAEDGFIKCKFLPILQPGKIYDLPEEYYTHYPPLPDLINGLMRKIGFKSLLAFRFPHIIAATLAALFWFLFIRNIYGPMAGFLCLFFLIILPEFFWYSYAIHIFSLDQFYRFGVFYVVSLLFTSESKKKNYLYASLWLLLFFQSITSLEYIFYLQLYIWLFAFLFKVKGKKKLLWLMSAPAFGLFLHLLQNAWALGGIANVISDLTSAYMHRSGLEKGYTTFLAGSIERLFSRFTLLIFGSKAGTALWRASKAILFFIITALSFFELRKLEKFSSFWRYLLLFFICDISWHFLLPQHAGHVHVIRTLLPTVAFLIGMLVYFNIETLLKQISSHDKLLLMNLTPQQAGGVSGQVRMNGISSADDINIATHPRSKLAGYSDVNNYIGKASGIIKIFMIVMLISLVLPHKIQRLARTIKSNMTSSPKEYEYRDLKNYLPKNAILFSNIGDACLIRYYLDRRTYFTTVSMVESKIKELSNKPFFNKDSLFFVYARQKTNPEERKYLSSHSGRKTTYKEMTIYKLVLNRFNSVR